jgi:CHAT domain-containing protein
VPELSRSAPRGALQSWSALPGTRREAGAIRGLFQQRFARGRTTSLSGSKASKPAVRTALAQHRHVHLATHGFFAPASLRSALAQTGSAEGLFGREGVMGWHPMLLSGIVLAGANREPGPGEEDGILTALEVSELDLARVDLAVLSACQTGLGMVAAGEGPLLGLQRAFQTAGARSLVTSLWSVHDAATSVLMEEFYTRLWGKPEAPARGPLTKLEALRQAQLFVLGNPGAVRKRMEQLRAELVKAGVKEAVLEARGFGKKALALPAGGKGKGQRSPPAWWAAFILSGDWR